MTKLVLLTPTRLLHFHLLLLLQRLFPPSHARLLAVPRIPHAFYASVSVHILSLYLEKLLIPAPRLSRTSLSRLISRLIPRKSFPTPSLHTESGIPLLRSCSTPKLCLLLFLAQCIVIFTVCLLFLVNTEWVTHTRTHR